MTDGPVAGTAVTLAGRQMAHRTFLLGNQGGFVLYLPVELNERDATLLPIKWFGASSFGRQYVAASRLWLCRGTERIALNRSTQTCFTQTVDGVTRTYEAGGVTVRQSFFVPNHLQAVVMTLEADRAVQLIVEPQFDMRYYQSFNTDFSRYAAGIAAGEPGERLRVSNQVPGPSSEIPQLDFHALVGTPRGTPQIELLPVDQRLRHKRYLIDEHRDMLIHGAYLETHEAVPDEAPIWDQYSTSVYAPAHITVTTPCDLVYGFGITAEEAHAAFEAVCSGTPALRAAKRADGAQRLEQGRLETGQVETDRAYAQILTRFTETLVARGMRLNAGGDKSDSSYDAIFAGNKYFLDAWKRDENISLGGLLTTGDFATVRAILNDTWRFQDERTGRLPHIIRLGEPLVYYSSDGTLWALRRLHQYTRASGDASLLDDKYAMVEHFFAASLNFVARGLLPSGGIIDPAYRWETWEDTPYTPRDGYPVEIELLWLTVLADFLPVLNERNPALAGRCRQVLAEGRESFTLFRQDGYLADSLSYDWEPRTILTPNGYIAFGLGYPLPADLARQMVLLGREQLGGRVGIRSLAPRDWARVLSPEFVSDPHRVHGMNMASVGIYNYHRGIEWLWLNQFFVAAELQYGDATHAFERYLLGQIHEALHEGGIGGLSELYDLHGALGADFQAWSMTGFVESLHAFAGITVDAVDRRVTVRPSVPDRWPYLACRRQVGDTRFDLRYEQEKADLQQVEVTPVDRVPAGYRLRIGVRLPAGRRSARVTLNGHPAAAQEVEGSAWVECPFDGAVRARFETDA